jgi:hypothetical protein
MTEEVALPVSLDGMKHLPYRRHRRRSTAYVDYYRRLKGVIGKALDFRGHGR